MQNDSNVSSKCKKCNNVVLRSTRNPPEETNGQQLRLSFSKNSSLFSRVFDFFRDKTSKKRREGPMAGTDMFFLRRMETYRRETICGESVKSWNVFFSWCSPIIPWYSVNYPLFYVSQLKANKRMRNVNIGLFIDLLLVEFSYFENKGFSLYCFAFWSQRIFKYISHCN